MNEQNLVEAAALFVTIAALGIRFFGFDQTHHQLLARKAHRAMAEQPAANQMGASR
jgi:hypothetical protein